MALTHLGTRASTQWKLLARLVACVALAAPAGCAVGDQELDPSYSEAITSGRTVGNWSGLPSGVECLVGMQLFYPNHFGVHIPLAAAHWTGDCAPDGACHLWLDAQPDSSEWERIPNDGHHTPTTYDLIVYPPVGSDPWGHIAAVDHVEGNNIFVMDDNYVCHHCRSASPHTVAWPAYGWYHLRRLPGGSGSTGGGSTSGGCSVGGYYCGGDVVSGDHSTLYRCTGGTSGTVAEHCANGCTVRSGQDDVCAPASAPPPPSNCVTGGLYCGTDRISGDRNTLYRCNGSSTAPTALGHCANGCDIRSGQDDACHGSGGCVYGGVYCGGDKVEGDPSVLYRCTGNSSGTVVEHCASGCAVLSGRDDACR